jgi:hypothetical protein
MTKDHGKNAAVELSKNLRYIAGIATAVLLS